MKDHKVPKAEAVRAVAHAKEFTSPESKDFQKGLDHVVSKVLEKGGLTPLTNKQVALENNLNALSELPPAEHGEVHPDADDR